MSDAKRVRELIEDFYVHIAPVCRDAEEGCSAIFELNTSNNSEFVARLLKGQAFARTPNPSRWIVFFVALARELLKRVVLSALAIALRPRRGTDMAQLRSAEAALVGFVAERPAGLAAKDFDGFRNAYLSGKAVVTLGQRLPYVPWRNYLRTRSIIPVEAYIRWTDVFRSLAQAWRLYSTIRNDHRLRDTPVERLFLDDFRSGHGVGSALYAAAACRLLHETPLRTVVHLPMERHEWEQSLLYGLGDQRDVVAVQACTFSPLDLNMYIPGPSAPRYRRMMPRRLYAMSESWAHVFRQLGFACAIEIAREHRFSKAVFPLALSRGTGRILYLGSINPAKVVRDLDALTALSSSWRVFVRLHPSLANVPQASRFAKSDGLRDAYDWCVFSDTSMVFQLECDRRRLVWVDHDDLPNQDPTRWFADWPVRILKAPLPADALAGGGPG